MVDLVGAQQRIVDATGYRLWSGYISPALLPSPATCHPEQ
jgi:hypothetical protein